MQTGRQDSHLMTKCPVNHPHGLINPGKRVLTHAGQPIYISLEAESIPIRQRAISMNFHYPEAIAFTYIGSPA